MATVWQRLRGKSVKGNQRVGGVFLAGSMLLHGCALSPAAKPPAKPMDATLSPDAIAKPATAPELVTASRLTYQSYALPTSEVHVVTVPPGSGQIQAAVASSLTPLSAFAEAEGAIAAINAGFFDPQNGLTTSYVTIAGAVVADPQQNDRLVQNPDLQTYLPAILNRSEFRVYDCAGAVQYDITWHENAAPPGCQIAAAVGAGPKLLPALTGYEEGFFADDQAGVRVRDALGSQAANARSAIGLKADGTVVLAIAAQVPQTEAPTGLSLAEMADFLQSLGVQQALNLDGGSSSGLYIHGQSHFGRLDEAGHPLERPIKSILLVR